MKSKFFAQEKRMSKLSEWINGEIEERGWTYNELARRAELSSGHLSLVVNDRQKAGPEFCNAIARAFREPPEKVFRLAGLLSELPAPEDDLTLSELMQIAKHLTAKERREVLEYALWRYKRQKGQQTGEAAS